jgi:YVTN family beta-propeller protein
MGDLNHKHCMQISHILLCLLLIVTSSKISAQPDHIRIKQNIYESAGASMFADIARKALPRVYVPNTNDNTVSIIDPTTYRVIKTLATGKDPEHIVPSYDLQTIWVLNDLGNSVMQIDPNTAKLGKTIPVNHPYNLYYTPDGRYAIIVDDIQKRLDFRHPQTMVLHDSLPVKCEGINHMDFTAEGRYAIASCELSSMLVKIDVAKHKVIKYLRISLKHSQKHAMPQDVRSSPDGSTFYVADMMMDGVFLIDPYSFQQIGFIATGKGAHSIYPSRDGKLMYISNRGCNMMSNCPQRGPGNIAVLDPTTQKIIARWLIPGGGSPDMGNVSADGSELWLSGKFDKEVYVFNTTTGELSHRIPVGNEPHGLTYWPQPGRYSLGHTGIMR